MSIARLHRLHHNHPEASVRRRPLAVLHAMHPRAASTQLRQPQGTELIGIVHVAHKVRPLRVQLIARIHKRRAVAGVVDQRIEERRAECLSPAGEPLQLDNVADVTEPTQFVVLRRCEFDFMRCVHAEQFVWRGPLRNGGGSSVKMDRCLS